MFGNVVSKPGIKCLGCKLVRNVRLSWNFDYMKLPAIIGWCYQLIYVQLQKKIRGPCQGPDVAIHHTKLNLVFWLSNNFKRMSIYRAYTPIMVIMGMIFGNLWPWNRHTVTEYSSFPQSKIKNWSVNITIRVQIVLILAFIGYPST